MRCGRTTPIISWAFTMPTTSPCTAPTRPGCCSCTRTAASTPTSILRRATTSRSLSTRWRIGRSRRSLHACYSCTSRAWSHQLLPGLRSGIPSGALRSLAEHSPDPIPSMRQALASSTSRGLATLTRRGRAAARMSCSTAPAYSLDDFHRSLLPTIGLAWHDSRHATPHHDPSLLLWLGVNHSGMCPERFGDVLATQWACQSKGRPCPKATWAQYMSGCDGTIAGCDAKKAHIPTEDERARLSDCDGTGRRCEGVRSRTLPTSRRPLRGRRL